MRILLLFAALLTSVLSHAVDVNTIRLWDAEKSTRVVLDLSAPVEHTLFMLDKPKRVVIDIKQARNRASTKAIKFSGSPINTIRMAARNQGDLRIVLDLNQVVTPRSFLLPGNKDKPDRLVIDLLDKNARVPITTEVAQGLPKKNNPASTNADIKPDRPAADPVPKAPPSISATRDIIIAIDAGHGGKDPGARGPTGAREKDIVLAISKDLARLVNNTSGYRAVMIRNGDYFVPLVKRRDKAREAKANLMVSIHADAFTSPRPRGASVFALSQRGASSEMASFLAKSANNSDNIGGEIGDISIADLDKELGEVLVDLSMSATLKDSIAVGGFVIDRLKNVAKLHKPRVEQAGFVVLKSPDVASILVETGFISNPKEERLLKTRAYQKKLANSIFKGIKNYFEFNPPPNTLIAARGREVHTVKSGESLSIIAARYGISLARLKAMNSLSNSVIRVGQTLKIPAKN